MKKLIQICIPLLVALVLAFPAQAQTVLTPTTLSAAISDSKVQTMVVASATGFVAGTTVAYIDRELVTVKAVSGTSIGIIRGQGGTAAAPHASAALVFVGTANQVFSTATEPQGSCARANEAVLPRINARTGIISDCLGGEWVNGIRTGTTGTKFRLLSPDPGAVVYTALNTNGTTAGNTTVYCTEVNVPYNKLLTGIALLNGTTVGTDTPYVILYDAGGTAVANSAVTGAVSAGTSVYQERAFTSKYYAVGPARYYACFQTNTGTDTVRMVVTGLNDQVLTKGQTAATFGTIPALTVPTTFTTAVGPYVYLY